MSEVPPYTQAVIFSGTGPTPSRSHGAPSQFVCRGQGLRAADTPNNCTCSSRARREDAHLAGGQELADSQPCPRGTYRSVLEDPVGIPGCVVSALEVEHCIAAIRTRLIRLSQLGRSLLNRLLQRAQLRCLLRHAPLLRQLPRDAKIKEGDRVDLRLQLHCLQLRYLQLRCLLRRALLVDRDRAWEQADARNLANLFH